MIIKQILWAFYVSDICKLCKEKKKSIKTPKEKGQFFCDIKKNQRLKTYKQIKKITECNRM